MNDANLTELERRVLVLAPTRRDAELTVEVLTKAGVTTFLCRSVTHLISELARGAATILVPEEVASRSNTGGLHEWLEHQPAWSDLPVLVLARSGADSATVAQVMEGAGNITVLERPMRVAALVSATRVALKARWRQYQIRDHIAERESTFRAEAFMASIVTSSDDAIISKTLDGIILSWNAGAERIFGYTAKEAIGQPILILIPPERADEETTLLDLLRRGQRIEHFETVRVTKDGRRLDMSLTVSPVRAADGTIIAASKVARDISQRKQAEAALRDADRRKDEFLAILAHELRNPLAPIRNSLHLLRLDPGHEEVVHQASEMMERQVNHMVRLVDDLLEVSRFTRGKIELRKEPLEVTAIIEHALETSGPAIEGAGHALIVDVPPESMIVEGDPVRLAQVFANLLINAAKYTDPGGTITLAARILDHHAVVSIKDTGVGIPPELLPTIFDLFTQVDRHGGRAQGGLGIGLTLAKRLVEMHGGDIQAHSDGPGRGSEFSVQLPLANSRPIGMRVAVPPRIASLDSQRILVVDDNRDSAESLGLLLRLLGAEVSVAYSGPEALVAIESVKPAVAILDIGMPQMDGYQLARAIRAEPLLNDVILVALTGWGQDDDRALSRAAGFDHHLVKPADIDALRRLLRSINPAHVEE
ncbi:MAG TPA: PAS domain S-box protein [Gemmatimonadales bacterium]